MSLFNSLYTSAGGMQAQQLATSNISTNIANLNTNGYRRSDISFKELIGDPARSRHNGSVNNVSTSSILRADVNGSIQRTSSPTDIAVSGNGFFTVKAGTDSTLETLFTRAGDFFADAGGILRNTAGFVLHGWALNQDGSIQGSQTSESSLVPVDVNILESQILPTSTASIALNLNASEEDYDPHRFSTAQQLPADSKTAHFSRSLTVYDTLGTPRNVNLEFRKIVGPMAHFTSRTALQMNREDVLVDNPQGPTNGITAGDTLEIGDGTNTLSVSFVNGAADTSLNEANTMADLLYVINNFTDADNVKLFEARLNSSGQLLVQAKDPTSTMDISTSSASVLGSTGLNFIQDPDDTPDYTYEPDFDITADPTDTVYPGQGDFPAFSNDTNPNTQGWWEVTLTIPDPADPTNGSSTILRQGLINFDSTGGLNASADSNGDILLDMASTPVNFDDADDTEDVGFTLDMSAFTQFTGNYNVIYSTQDGAGVGNFSGIEIGRDGIVTAEFSNGQRIDIYKLPLATFSNANGLRAISGTAFARTEDSGEPTFSQVDENGAGSISSTSLESSNVDLSGEFGNLIVTQRAFSLNGQVLNAVDEMTRNLVQLKR